MKHLADLITCSRIAASLVILSFPLSSLHFLVLYVLAGLSDILDGWVARRTCTSSEFGSRLDSAADTFFIAAYMLKVVPEMDVPIRITGWLCVIILLKAGITIAGFMLYRRYGFHTRLNKITGILLFLLPFTLPVLDIEFIGTALCIMGSAAAIQEIQILRSSGGLPPSS